MYVQKYLKLVLRFKELQKERHFYKESLILNSKDGLFARTKTF